MAQQYNVYTDYILCCWNMYMPLYRINELDQTSNIFQCRIEIKMVCFHRSTLFTELRILLEHFIMKPACPVFFRRICLSSIAFISRLAPTGVWLHLVHVLAFFPTIWNFDGHRHFYQQKELFSWMSTLQSVLLLYVWSTAKSIQKHGDNYFSCFNVTSFKQWIQLMVSLHGHNKHQLTPIFINHCNVFT